MCAASQRPEFYQHLFTLPLVVQISCVSAFQSNSTAVAQPVLSQGLSCLCVHYGLGKWVIHTSFGMFNSGP